MDLGEKMKEGSLLYSGELANVLQYIGINCKYHHHRAILDILIDKLSNRNFETRVYAIKELKKEMKHIEELKKLSSEGGEYVFHEAFRIILNRYCEVCNADRVINICSALCDDESEQINCENCNSWVEASTIEIEDDLKNFEVIGKTDLTHIWLLKKKNGNR